MKLLTEQLRNGQIEVQNAIDQAERLIPEYDLFFRSLNYRIGVEKQVAIEEELDKQEQKSNERYDEGFNAGLDDAEGIIEEWYELTDENELIEKIKEAKK